jgi:hypothetical protein
MLRPVTAHRGGSSVLVCIVVYCAVQRSTLECAVYLVCCTIRFCIAVHVTFAHYGVTNSARGDAHYRTVL